METVHVDRDKYDVIEESTKIDEIHEGIKQFQKESQNVKTNQEKIEFLEKFNEFASSFGPAFELKVFVTVDGPIVASEAKAGATFLNFSRIWIQMKLPNAYRNVQKLLEGSCKSI